MQVWMKYALHGGIDINGPTFQLCFAPWPREGDTMFWVIGEQRFRCTAYHVVPECGTIRVKVHL